MFLLNVAGKRLYNIYRDNYSKAAAAEKARQAREKHLKLQRGGGKSNNSNDGREDVKIIVKKDDGIDPTKGTPIGRCIRRICTMKVKIWSFITTVFFITPLLVGIVVYFEAPDDFFISSLSTSDARLMLYISAVGPPYLWFIFVCLRLTLEERQMPQLFRTKEAYNNAIKLQRDLDDKFSRNLRWPRWMLYEYPYWSLGNGLITTGERRELAVRKGYRVNMKKFGIAWFVLFFIPIVVFLPIFVEEKVWIRNNDIDSGIGEWTLFAFIVGYPSIFVIFYTWRCIANVLPSEVKAMGFPIAVYFFFFVVIPLGIVEPLTAEKFIYLTSDSALILRAIVLGLPSSLAGSAIAVLVFRVGAVWDWFHSLRIEQSIKHDIANFFKNLQPYVVLIPIALFIWSLIILLMWESKNQTILTIFVVTDTTLQFVFCFVFACGEIALLWGNHIKTTGGIERITPFMMLAISIYISVQGSKIMDKYITQRKPYIQERVDEDDSMLYIFTQNVVLCNILLIAMTKYKTYDNWIQMDYKRRFGHHPEDWEIDEPSLLERHMPTLIIQRKAEREAAIRSRRSCYK